MESVMKNRQTGEPRGFAFVVFSEGETVDAVMAEDKHEINHKIVDVKRAQARGIAPPSIHGGEPEKTATTTTPTASTATTSSSTEQQSQNNNPGEPQSSSTTLTPEQLHTKVFVGGIPPHIDRDELRTIFTQFGPVVDSIVMLDQTTMRSRGFGFVTFENGSNGAQKSIDAQPVHMHGRQVEVKLATPRAEQKRVPPVGSKHVGLRAGQQSSASSGEFAGLAVAFGRSGWKAGYGSKAFGAAGWAVQGWEDGGPAPERSGFSFERLVLRTEKTIVEEQPPNKRQRAH
jgi:RNA recognition motif-containing protein